MADFPFDIVGFDLDGTLLDTHEDLGAAVNHALALAGRAPVAVAEVRALIGGGAKKMLERALILTGGCQDSELKPLYRELLRFYQANIAVHTRPFPGTVAMLVLITVYALLALAVAVVLQVRDANKIVEMLFYLVAGLLWVLPAGVLVKWMQKPDA